MNYEVVIIEEGLGNLNDCSYYTRQAIEAAAATRVFEGAQAYADHPDRIEEQTRPERSVRDLIGFYSETRATNNPETGAAMLVAKLSTNPGDPYEWSRSLIETAIDNSGKFDKDLIGISINAGGAYTKKNIDDVIADATLPVSVKPKLIKAKESGATEVDWCVELSDVVSADLVTRAGARGRALKRLVESERSMFKKKTKENEMDKSKEAVDDNSGHADAAQDKELIKSMLKKYVGGEDHSDEECEAMGKLHAEAKEAGLDGEEAEKAAGYAMKMAKHSAGKKEAAKKEDDMAMESAKKEESHMESESVKALKKTVDYLTKKIRENEVKEFLNKTVQESGFEGKVAKKFKESIGAVKDESEISARAKIFKEALALASGGEMFMNPEKTTFNSEDATVSFADCVKE